ncbi:hypothetical protein [Thalassotalea sp. PLHSN55]|uniref:hypothetical protein n=1 Tax=Thalassotalea sp. PLHSN55 TaxID=3435888 RepID=UPI003F8489EB
MQQLLRIEEQVSSSDGLGHGPDVGSGEWKSSIEFRLGVKHNSDIPNELNLSWCNKIEQTLKAK